ncbi:hypothetical protein CBR_g28755 [Chara braunii]|uniref:Uncharacterized protein n=1 Tax=Chara braunii TaxID=69332 RepID=A0A388L9Q8_CHABU|nr:hypothetical protein CBR_g28755 [Chara braunii]|eukprot:GBG79041.1 hypothetical protein CBR_g28755 [Chara braunii]
MAGDPVIGIDLGTSYCCVAVFFNQDKIEIVQNELGARITPSYVAFSGKDGCLVGEAAKRHGMKYPKQCVFEVKRLMGRSFHDATVQRDAQTWPFKLSSGPLGQVLVHVGETEVLPEEISACLLRKMKSIAEDYTDCHPIRDAVISVPAYFNYRQRKATMAAAIDAKLNVLRLMSEPTAAALAYAHQRLRGSGSMEKKVMVFDMGGGTFDVSIVTMKAGQHGEWSFVVNAVAGDSHLGGSDIDKRLIQHAEEQFRGQHQAKSMSKYAAKLFKRQQGHRKDFLLGDPRILRKLNQAAVEAKHDLSVKTDAEILLDCRENIFNLRLDRVEFERLNQRLFRRCMTIVRQALCDAKMSKSDISDVLLAGGSTRIPKLQEMLTAFFGKPPIKSVSPDEAVAFGAAVMAGQLARRDKCKEAPTISVRDVTSVSIGVCGRFGIMKVVVPRNSPLPADGEVGCVLYDNQESMEFPLYEGERALCVNNLLLGELSLDGFTRGPATADRSMRVVIKIDANGILHAMAEAIANHKDIGRKVETTVTLGKDAVRSVQPSDAVEETDWYTPEAKAEDARIWAADRSMHRLRDPILALREQLRRCNKCHACLEKHVTEAAAWWMGLKELPSKEECDKKYEELEVLAKVHNLALI